MAARSKEACPGSIRPGMGSSVRPKRLHDLMDATTEPCKLCSGSGLPWPRRNPKSSTKETMSSAATKQPAHAHPPVRRPWAQTASHRNCQKKNASHLNMYRFSFHVCIPQTTLYHSFSVLGIKATRLPLLSYRSHVPFLFWDKVSLSHIGGTPVCDFLPQPPSALGLQT